MNGSASKPAPPVNALARSLTTYPDFLTSAVPGFSVSELSSLGAPGFNPFCVHLCRICCPFLDHVCLVCAGDGDRRSGSIVLVFFNDLGEFVSWKWFCYQFCVYLCPICGLFVQVTVADEVVGLFSNDFQ